MVQKRRGQSITRANDRLCDMMRAGMLCGRATLAAAPGSTCSNCYRRTQASHGDDKLCTAAKTRSHSSQSVAVNQDELVAPASDTWYFQFADSYARHGSILAGSGGDRRVVCLVARELAGDMLDDKQLLEQLGAARRRRLGDKSQLEAAKKLSRFGAAISLQ